MSVLLSGCRTRPWPTVPPKPRHAWSGSGRTAMVFFQSWLGLGRGRDIASIEAVISGNKLLLLPPILLSRFFLMSAEWLCRIFVGHKFMCHSEFACQFVECCLNVEFQLYYHWHGDGESVM